MEHHAAIEKANETLSLLIQHQPGLVQIVAADSNAAANAAAFILTLRAGLIDMYKATPVD